MIPLDQLLTVPTVDETVDKITTMLVALSVPADKWRKGGPLSLMRRVFATFYVALAAAIVSIAGYGLLTKSKGPWLDLLAFYVYGVTRTPATFGTGTLTLTNTQGGIFPFGPREAIFQNVETKATYTNDDAFTLNAGPGTSLTINISAIDVGTLGNANPGDISVLVTQMPGVTCTNTVAVVGLDAQSDADLTATCLQRLSARSVRGPRNAYAYYATHAADDTPLRNDSGNPVNVNRVQVSGSSHTGIVTTWVAAPSGAASFDDVNAVRDNIEANVRPEAVTSVVVSAVEALYSASFIVWCSAEPGLQASNVAIVALTNITEFLETYKVGGLKTSTAQGLFGSLVESKIAETNDAIFKVEGAVDLLLVDGQVATNGITLGSFDVRIVS